MIGGLCFSIIFTNISPLIMNNLIDHYSDRQEYVYFTFCGTIRGSFLVGFIRSFIIRRTNNTRCAGGIVIIYRTTTTKWLFLSTMCW